MEDITNLEAALLGVLCEKPRHAYEIEKVIEERDMRYWTEVSMSSVYKTLKKLEGKDLAKSTVKLSDKNVAQKVYTVTPEGRRTMKAKVRRLVSGWEKCMWPLHIGMSNLGLLSPPEVKRSFAEFDKSIDEAIRCYGDLKKYLEAHCEVYGVALASHPLAILQAEKAWARAFVKEYEKTRK